MAYYCQHLMGMLQVVCHLPHSGVGAPVVEYFGVNQCDGKQGHPVVGARDSIPIHRNLVVHDCRESL